MSLRELLKDPFGPYPDVVILDAKCKSNSKRMVTLSSLSMQCDGVDIGFDESEVYPNPRTSSNPVTFRGIVELKSLSWLSPAGRELIEDDLRERDIEKRQTPQNNPVSKLTLAGLYNHRDEETSRQRSSKLRAKVWILGEKNMSVTFLTSSLLPEGLILTSKDQNRQYEVLSMSAGFYFSSRNFLARYRLLGLMQKIVKEDPEKTAIQNRTIDYFVDRYMEIYAADDDDSEDEDEGEDVVMVRPRMRSGLSPLEMRGHFASQSEWILVDQLAKRTDKRIVNLKSWDAFCRQVRRERKEARHNGHLWGLPYGDVNEEDFADTFDIKRYPMFGKDMARLLEIARKKWRKDAQDMEVAPPSENDEPEEPDADADEQHRYDSDFSVASTPPGSDAGGDSDRVPLDPELFKAIPEPIWYAPELPDVGFTWFCPVPRCTYTIDLLRPTDENVDGLRVQEVQYLRSKRWSSIREDRIAQSFYAMVARHYDKHLGRNGVRIRQSRPKKWVVEWIKPKPRRS